MNASIVILEKEWDCCDIQSHLNEFNKRLTVVLDYCGSPLTSVAVQLIAQKRNLRYFSMTQTYYGSYKPKEAAWKTVDGLKRQDEELIELSVT